MALQAIKQTAIVVGGANAVGFLITALLKTHKITDLIGTGSFVLASLQLTKNNWKTIFHNPAIPWFQNRLFWINAGVILWGSRLGAYLFSRILYTHEDKRLAKFFPEKDEGLFDKTKSNFPINLGGFWSIQALWGIICLLPVSMINSIPNSNTAVANALSSLNIKVVAEVFTKNLGSGVSKLLSLPLGWLPIAGIFTGIAIESIADYQKTKYRSNKSNDNHWCDSGLWSLSRYPNYFGEMLTWWSIYAASLPSLLRVSAHPVYRFLPPVVGLLSPAFITWLLLNLSGIPLLEKKQQKQYGDNAEYKEYVKNTPLLIPWPKFGLSKDERKEK